MLSLAIGALVGLLSGLFGIGGSIVATPLFRLAGIEPLIALATPLPAIIPTALAGSFAYARQGLIRWGTAAWILAGGVPATVLGALATRWLSPQSLMVATGVVLLLVGIRFLWESLRGVAPEPRVPPARASTGALLSVGFGAGLLGGLLAIGAGIVLVPALTLGFGFPLKEALATSLVCVAGLAIPGTLAHAFLGHIDAGLLLPFVLGSIPLAYLGGSIAVGLSSRRLRLLYGSFVVGFAVYFVWTQLQS
jgi:uncharacterized membrane protein YfcA